jgi:outer membrane protein TolC
MAAVVLGGCVHYTPHPLPPDRIVASFSERSLADPQLHTLLDNRLPARTAEWPRPQWDRADLLIAMLYFNDAVAQSRGAEHVALAARRTARERPNPTVSILTEYANQHDGSPLWLWAITPDWLLDFGTKRSARIAASDLSAQQAQYELTEVIWREREALRRALADMLITQREVSLLESVHQDRATQLEMARRRLELGAATRGDVDRLVGDAVLDEQRLYDARRRSSAARSALASTLGVPVAALDNVELTWNGIDSPQDVDEKVLQRWREDALLARGDVHGAVAAYSVAEQNLRLEVARQYPDLHIGPAYTWDHGVKRLQFNLASLALPIFNRNQGAIGEAEARREEAGARLEGTVATAYQEIDEAIRQWHIALARLADARGAVYDAAQRIYQETERGFQAGSNDRTELVAARIGRTLSELQVLDAVRTAQEALAVLEDAMRRPLEGPELEVVGELGAEEKR